MTTVHGGFDTAELRAECLTRDQVLDFSSNINPLGPSPRVRQAAVEADLSAYPDRECLDLREALSAELTLEFLGHGNLDARLHLETALPRAKGMASSTADVAAAIGATTAALRTSIAPRQQAKLALAVEPSDGVMLPGIALFDHRGGRVAQSLGQPPAMRVLALEFPDQVDTEAFNAVDRRAEHGSHASQFREALDLITTGLANGDFQPIGEGATLSSLANQDLLPKPQLASVLDLAQAAGAVGVNVAHSGTVLGLLFAEDADRIGWAERRAWSRLPGLVAVHNRRVVGGGVTTIQEASPPFIEFEEAMGFSRDLQTVSVGSAGTAQTTRRLGVPDRRNR